MSTTPTPQPTPSILDQLKQLPGSVIDAVKSRYMAGPPQGAPSAGPGSVLDQRNQHMQPLLPPQQPLVAPQQLMQQQQQPAPADLVHPAPYGTRPGEKQIDVTEYQKPLGGLSGVKRK